MKLNREELCLLAKGLNHTKDYYRNAIKHMKDVGLEYSYENIELDNLEALADKLGLDGDYFTYGGITR